MDEIIKKKNIHINNPVESRVNPPKLWPKFILVFTNIEKLDRLTQALTGHTYTTVESSLVLDSSVPIILAMLYGKPEHS